MTERFLNRNLNNIGLLNEFIKINRGNISLIVTSNELFLRLQELGLIKNVIGDIGRYDDVRIIRDYYFPGENLNFVFKNTNIKFDLPCVCGVYSDEEHDKLR